MTDRSGIATYTEGQEAVKRPPPLPGPLNPFGFGRQITEELAENYEELCEYRIRMIDCLKALELAESILVNYMPRSTRQSKMLDDFRTMVDMVRRPIKKK